MIDQVKLIIAAVSLAVLLSVGYFGYSYVKNIGYTEATKECEQKFTEYQNQINLKLEKIESNVSIFTDTLVTNNASLTQDIGQILKQVKNTQNIVIKNGKCTPTEDYLKKLNDAINRANK